MCGIVGYLGTRPAFPLLKEGLTRLEYRGYDSAGLITLDQGRFFRTKAPGKLTAFFAGLSPDRFPGPIGVAHTRWATHGPPSEANAHPHLSCDGSLGVVHNGIIENFEEIRDRLRAGGHRFASETDSEVIAHLLEDYLRREGEPDPLFAFHLTISELRGSFAVIVIFRDRPQLLAHRHGSPLVWGRKGNEHLLASDIPPLLSLTREVTPLEDGETLLLDHDGAHLLDLHGRPVFRPPLAVTWTEKMAEKYPFPHFTLKEIHEQPEAIRDTLSAYLHGEEIRFPHLSWTDTALGPEAPAPRLVLVACGTAWYAGLVGKYLFEDLARVPVEVAAASEFRYGRPVLDPGTVVVAISQSGETADTLASVRLAREAGCRVFAVCNVQGSTLLRESSGHVLTMAGPEIGVASTKAYTCQLTALALLAISLGRWRGTLPRDRCGTLLAALQRLPAAAGETLRHQQDVLEAATRLSSSSHLMFIGRRYNFPTALEGALKLKELSYLHAEGYAAGELKHGPLALIDASLPTVAIASHDSVQDKLLSNLAEIKARQGPLLLVGDPREEKLRRLSPWILYAATTEECLSPIINIIPLQLLAYHVACLRGRDVDQPRNLAKSVTVE